MDRPLISVVLPTFNRERLIKRALDSVLRQTYSNIEVIVVDDSSSDGTVDLLSSIDDVRVKIIRHEKNLGASAARNTGIDAATGEYISFQDSDDVWLPHKLERQLGVLRSTPDSKFLFGPYVRSEGPNAKVFGYVQAQDICKINELLLNENLLTPQTILADARFMKEFGKYDTEFLRYEDWDQALRLCNLTRFTYCPEPLVIVFQTPGSLSSNLLYDGSARQRLAAKHFDKFTHYTPYLAKNYAEAGYTLVASRKRREGLICFRTALYYSPFSKSVWVRILKTLFRSVIGYHVRSPRWSSGLRKCGL